MSKTQSQRKARDSWVATAIRQPESPLGVALRNTVRAFNDLMNSLTTEQRCWLIRMGKRMDRLAAVDRAEYRRRTRRRNRRR